MRLPCVRSELFTGPVRIQRRDNECESTGLAVNFVCDPQGFEDKRMSEAVTPGVRNMDDFDRRPLILHCAVL